MAAAMAGITIYNLPPSPPNYDRVGTFYIAFCITWTTILIAGMVFCWWNRRIPILRVRGIWLSFPAIALLHLYWVLGQMVYPVGAAMPTVIAYDVQYFGMGVWFPLGIALFQASNLRFLHVAKMQKQYVYPELRAERKCNGGGSSWLCRLRDMDYMKRTMMFIGIAMVVQLIITIAMWLACRKYHPTYGIPGTEIKGATLPEQIVYLGRGWEWWQSVLWQVIWTWIAAPILIWKAWGIRDTMGWRTQTIACCISGLHATPMFMAATYAPAFAKVNVYFPQSQWIQISVMMWEILTVFVPVYEIIRLWALNKKTNSLNRTSSRSSSTMLTIVADLPSPVWQKPFSSSSTSTLAEKGQSVESIQEFMGDRLYTKEALEYVLANNPTELQEFAALSDFSGENIAFLSEVAAWKSRWPAILEEQQTPVAFNEALRIYADFISPQDAEFPLNISSHTLKQVQAIFEKPARIVFGDRTADTNEIAPFESSSFTPASKEFAGVQYTGAVPGGFDTTVFNFIEDHIKDLVLTNTWARFVQSMRRRSTDTDRSDFTAGSKSSLRSWILETRSKLQSFI